MRPIQRIVIHSFVFYDRNFARLMILAGPWLWSDLKHPGMYRIVQQVVGSHIPRGDAAHDELCATLTGMSPQEYRKWVAGNDAFENR